VTADGTVVLRDMPVDVKPGRPAQLGAGDMFGEMSALSRYPVSADVIATEPTRCLLIATAALRKMLAKAEFAEFKEQLDGRYRARTLASHLRRVDIFADLDVQTINHLRDRAELLSFEPGNVIVEQGATDAAFYLVRGGYVKVGLQSGGGDLAVTYLRKGDHAGEVSLLLDEPWPFSLSALEHVELVRIGQRDFREAVAPYPDVEKALWDKAVQRLKERGYAARNPLSSQYLQMAMDTGLIHGESVLLIDLDRCTRCDDCVRACADTHGGQPKFIREGLKYRNWSIPTSCYQCTDPVCMIGCPTGAISRPIGTAEVLINKDTCIGCGVCSRRCPWDNIIPVPYESAELGRQIDLATKCDQCFGRAAGPACVQMCPHDAAIRINFKDVETVIGTLSR
jgi:Fe-S-cluster-containing dehydrogenase component